MADDDSKTEAPTEKRLLESMARGNAPSSREAVIACSMCVLTLEIAMLWPKLATNILVTLSENLSFIADYRLSSDAFIKDIGWGACSFVWLMIWPILICRTGAGLMVSIIQNGLRAVPDRIAPRSERISPFRNAGRMFDTNAIVSFMLNLSKLGASLAIVSAAMIFLLGDGKIATLVEPIQVGRKMIEGIGLIASDVTLLMITVGGVDIFWSKRRWLKSLYMSRSEIKEEVRQNEGDQSLKARIRSITLARNRSHMIEVAPIFRTVWRLG